MLKKNYLKKGPNCRVTFKYANEENCKTAALVGDFTDWNIAVMIPLSACE